MVSQGSFREDLYFRLSVVQVENPPLVDRKEDIPQLVHHFMAMVSQRRGVELTISVDAMSALMSLKWPGNVRELRNVVERAGSLCDGNVVERLDLALGRDTHITQQLEAAAPPPASMGDLVPSGGSAFNPTLLAPEVPFKEAKQQVTDEFEQAYLSQLIQRNKGNITRSAQEAGLTRYHLRELLKRHKISTK